jgi:putative aldouronate transport system permease protein
MLNEVRNQGYKRIVQTVSYLPHFLSVVAIIGIFNLMLSPSNGFVNVALEKLFGMKRIYFMAEPGWFRPLYVISGIWQDVGWGAIIYLAALSQVDVQLYDAAIVDGATRLQRIRHISLPTIMPTIVILLILDVGSLFSVGFEKVILMYSPVTYETADVIGSYVYRRGLQFAEFSYGAAVGLFNSMVNIILLISTNWVARRATGQSLW